MLINNKLQVQIEEKNNLNNKNKLKSLNKKKIKKVKIKPLIYK